MITNTKLSYDAATGQVKLRNTFDCTAELQAARITRESNPSGRFGDKNGECYSMGYIPEEMWFYDPWLMCAKKARKQGDKGKFTYYVRKFFEVHRALATPHETRYWNGHRAVLL